VKFSTRNNLAVLGFVAIMAAFVGCNRPLTADVAEAPTPTPMNAKPLPELVPNYDGMFTRFCLGHCEYYERRTGYPSSPCVPFHAGDCRNPIHGR